MIAGKSDFSLVRGREKSGYIQYLDDVVRPIYKYHTKWCRYKSIVQTLGQSVDTTA